MDVQGLFDMLSDAARDTRKNYHVCLGELLDGLRQADPEGWVYLTSPHSYRGYYSDLALEPTTTPIRVWELINQLSDVIDTELTGYKGGEFLMSADTPVWVSHYGTTGSALVGFNPTTLTFMTKETD
jgi:hypothetical protein